MSRYISKRLDQLEKQLGTKHTPTVPGDLAQARARGLRLHSLKLANTISLAEQAEFDEINKLLADEDRDHHRILGLGLRQSGLPPPLSKEELLELADLQARYPMDPNDPLAESLKAFDRASRRSDWYPPDGKLSN
jgi:hypothetical protein